MAASSVLNYLERLQTFGIRPGLETITALLDRLDHPERRFQAVHVAGTNGKGSTASLLASILQARGQAGAAPSHMSGRIGLYTSPHLTDLSERIRVNGQPISRDAMADWADEIRRHAGTLEPTFFEFTTALAFLAFARAGVDLAVIETGLGGRWDATNVVSPLVSLITTVDYDHEEHLGATLERIAAEKAGIIKRGIPVVTAVETPEALTVIRAAATANRSTLYRVGEAVRVRGETPARFDYEGLRYQFKDLSCPLLGRHQLVNSGLALCAAELLEDRGFRLDESAVREGLRTVRCDGRLEVMRTSPLVIIDGAHNPAAAKAVAGYLSGRAAVHGGRIILIVGIMRDKQIPFVVQSLLPPDSRADLVIATRAACDRAAATSRLAEALRPYPVSLLIRERVPDAVQEALTRAGPTDIVCITGSFYVVGEARAHLLGIGAPSPLRG